MNTKLENMNLVGESSDKRLNHIFECHDELRNLRVELDRLKAVNTEMISVLDLILNGDDPECNCDECQELWSCAHVVLDKAKEIKP